MWIELATLRSMYGESAPESTSQLRDIYRYIQYTIGVAINISVIELNGCLKNIWMDITKSVINLIANLTWYGRLLWRISVDYPHVCICQFGVSSGHLYWTIPVISIIFSAGWLSELILNWLKNFVTYLYLSSYTECTGLSGNKIGQMIFISKNFGIKECLIIISRSMIY